MKNVFTLIVVAALLGCFAICVCTSAGTNPAEVAQAMREGNQSESQTRSISLPQAAVLGVIEGLTEYLPVSSTGHLILASHAMDLTHFGQQEGPLGRKMVKDPAINAFEIFIQFGAILAVVGLYRRRVGQMGQGLLAGGNALLRRDLGTMQDTQRSGLRLVALLMLAFLPAAVVGLLFHQQIEDNLFGPVPVMWALAVGGVLMIVVEIVYWRRRRADRPLVTQIDQMLYWQAAAIGMAQVLSMWPGTSRSMITMIAALVVGLDLVAAAEFSFLLALPTLGAATVYSGFKYRDDLLASAGVMGLLVGLIVSGLTAAVAVKAFVKGLTKFGLIPFGIYRILLAAALLVYFAYMI